MHRIRPCHSKTNLPTDNWVTNSTSKQRQSGEESSAPNFLDLLTVLETLTEKKRAVYTIG